MSAMDCPKCGTPMNHQADKLAQPVTKEEAAAVTDALDGIVVEVFACPSCGWIEARRLSLELRDG
jgi:hypothetical protein